MKTRYHNSAANFFNVIHIIPNIFLDRSVVWRPEYFFIIEPLLVFGWLPMALRQLVSPGNNLQLV